MPNEINLPPLSGKLDFEDRQRLEAILELGKEQIAYILAERERQLSDTGTRLHKAGLGLKRIYQKEGWIWVGELLKEIHAS